MLVSDVYQRVCDRILEPGGLQLGIITDAQFLVYLADSVNVFLRQTGISKIFTTRTIDIAVGIYSVPDMQCSVDECFVSGRFIPRSTLESIDNSNYQWRRRSGVPKVWYEDGLPINVVGLALPPNWQGTLYPFVGPGPTGYQLIGQDSLGSFAGTVNTAGLLVTRTAGDSFQVSDSTWQTGKSITVNGTTVAIAGVFDGDNLTVATSLGNQAGVPYTVQYPLVLPAADRNLTTYGSRISSSSAYSLGDPIPFLPDSACIYIAWGVLASMYSDDSELKDPQKAAYATARFTEGMNIFREVMLEELEDNDGE